MSSTPSTLSPDAIVIVSAARTPMGAFQSDFAALSAHDLGGASGVCPQLCRGSRR